MTEGIRIYRKDVKDECLYCPTCGKKKVYMSSTNHYLFSCSDCETEFVMMGKSNYDNIKERFAVLVSAMESEFDIKRLQELLKELRL